MSLMGCLGGDGGEGGALSESDVVQVQGALTAGQGERFCVLAPGQLNIEDRAVAQGVTGAGSLFLGVEGRINGNTFVAGNAVLRDRARINGNLTVSGTLTRGNGTVVTGTIRQNTPVDLPAIEAIGIPAGFDPVVIGPGANTTLSQGGYSDVLIRSRSTVRIGGDYDVTSWVVEPDVTLLENPPGTGVRINDTGRFVLGDRSSLTAPNPVAVILHLQGTTVSIGNRATLTGVIAAARAAVEIASGARVNGCVGGQQVVLRPDASIVSSNPGAAVPTAAEL
jgi:cytoskeletal protein CcmA (bactofilin family)